jgi:hypothetical protein
VTTPKQPTRWDGLEELVTLDEAARRLGNMSENSFRRHVMDDLPIVRLGGMRYVKVSDLRAWVQSQPTTIGVE